jgi:hypothetical protein
MKTILFLAAVLACGCQTSPVRQELTGKVKTEAFDPKTGKLHPQLGGEVSFKITSGD